MCTAEVNSNLQEALTHARSHHRYKTAQLTTQLTTQHSSQHNTTQLTSQYNTAQHNTTQYNNTILHSAAEQVKMLHASLLQDLIQGSSHKVIYQQKHNFIGREVQYQAIRSAPILS
jgi:hypothetical protein